MTVAMPLTAQIISSARAPYRRIRSDRRDSRSRKIHPAERSSRRSTCWPPVGTSWWPPTEGNRMDVLDYWRLAADEQECGKK